MKGGGEGTSDGLILIIFCCCCCVLILGIGSGVIWSLECTKDDAKHLPKDCYCDFDKCKAGNICNSSGICVNPNAPAPGSGGSSGSSGSGPSDTNPSGTSSLQPYSAPLPLPDHCDEASPSGCKMGHYQVFNEGCKCICNPGVTGNECDQPVIRIHKEEHKIFKDDKWVCEKGFWGDFNKSDTDLKKDRESVNYKQVCEQCPTDTISIAGENLTSNKCICKNSSGIDEDISEEIYYYKQDPQVQNCVDDESWRNINHLSCAEYAAHVDDGWCDDADQYPSVDGISAKVACRVTCGTCGDQCMSCNNASGTNSSGTNSSGVKTRYYDIDTQECKCNKYYGYTENPDRNIDECILLSKNAAGLNGEICDYEDESVCYGTCVGIAAGDNLECSHDDVCSSNTKCKGYTYPLSVSYENLDNCGIFTGRVVPDQQNKINYEATVLNFANNELKEKMEKYYNASGTYDQFILDSEGNCNYRKDRTASRSSCVEAEGWTDNCNDCLTGYELKFTQKGGFECVEKICDFDGDADGTKGCISEDTFNNIPVVDRDVIWRSGISFANITSDTQLCKTNQNTKLRYCDIDDLNNLHPSIGTTGRFELTEGRYRKNSSGIIECINASSCMHSTPSPCSPGYDPCINGTCTPDTSDVGFTCVCNENYVGYLCNINKHDICGVGNDFAAGEQVVTKLSQHDDPIGGIAWDYSASGAGRVVPIINSPIDLIKIGTKAETDTILDPILDHLIYPCNCSTNKDRRGRPYVGIPELGRDTFCNCPSQDLDTRQEATESVHQSQWITMYTDNNEIQENTLSNMKCFMDCGSRVFTSGGAGDGSVGGAGSSGHLDEGYNTGFYYKYDSTADASDTHSMCKQCPRPGTNQIKVQDYYGWGTPETGAIGSANNKYGDYKKRKDTINAPVPDTEKIIQDKIPGESYLSSDFVDLCKPAYPGFYGTIGKFEHDWTWTSALKLMHGSAPYAGGEKINDTSMPHRPVKSDYIARKKSDITGNTDSAAPAGCGPYQSYNWTPEYFWTKGGPKCQLYNTDGMADPDKVILDLAEARTKLKDELGIGHKLGSAICGDRGADVEIPSRGSITADFEQSVPKNRPGCADVFLGNNCANITDAARNPGGANWFGVGYNNTPHEIAVSAAGNGVMQYCPGHDTGGGSDESTCEYGCKVNIGKYWDKGGSHSPIIQNTTGSCISGRGAQWNDDQRWGGECHLPVGAAWPTE